MRAGFFFKCGMLCFPLFALLQAQDYPIGPLGPVSPQTGLLLTDEAVLELIHNSSGDRAHDYVSRLALWDRTELTAGYRAAAEWVAQKAREFGLQEVRIEEFPSDGETEYFGQRTGLAWKVDKGELWMTSPLRLLLTSYEDLPMALARNSLSADLETELVDIGSGLEDSDYPADVQGKLVLTSSHPGRIVSKAIHDKAAAGIVSYWSVPSYDYANRLPGDQPDQVGWGSLPQVRNQNTKTFAFMISSRRAQELKVLLDSNGSVRLRALVQAELVPGTLDVLQAVIPGSRYPDQEILVTAHLDHHKPGANDNASGSACILEMARSLSKLISQGTFPRPPRTIRFLWVPEYSGTWAWLSRHLNGPIQRIANLNYDMQGENLRKTNAVFAISYTPDWNPSFLNAVMESILDFMNKYNDERYPARKQFHIISVNGSRDRLSGRMVPFMTGTDYEVFNKLSIPGTEVLAWPDDYYHSSEDTPDKVDPTQLHRVVFSGLAAMSIIAYLDDRDLDSLAELALISGRRRIAGDEHRAARMILSAGERDFREQEWWARNLMRHAVERELAAARSCAVFASNSGLRRRVLEIADSLNDAETHVLRRLDNLALRRSRQLGISRDPAEPTVEERRAARLIPRRLAGQELLDLGYVMRQARSDSNDVDVEKIVQALRRAEKSLAEENEAALRIDGLGDAPAYYADGNRSILDIRDEVAADYTLIPIEILIEYFRAFEKAGVMEIVEKR